MTVTAYSDLTVECDFCHRKTSQTIVDEIGSIKFLARFHSRKHGWDVVDGYDICPKCQSDKALNPTTKDVAG